MYLTRYDPFLTRIFGKRVMEATRFDPFIPDDSARPNGEPRTKNGQRFGSSPQVAGIG